VLPVLYGDRFVARIEPVLDKKTRVLTIKNWWWEDGVRPSKAMQDELARCMRRYLRFLDASALALNDAVSSVDHMAWLHDLT
jgi:uncharacterized protein YcaQ